MQESIVFLVRVQCRRKESSRPLSHLLMSFLSLPWQQKQYWQQLSQSVKVAFGAGDAISEELDSCTISRKYVINSPRSCNCNKNEITDRLRSATLIIVAMITYFCTSIDILDRLDVTHDCDTRTDRHSRCKCRA